MVMCLLLLHAHGYVHERLAYWCLLMPPMRGNHFAFAQSAFDLSVPRSKGTTSGGVCNEHAAHRKLATPTRHLPFTNDGYPPKILCGSVTPANVVPTGEARKARIFALLPSTATERQTWALDGASPSK